MLSLALSLFPFSFFSSSFSLPVTNTSHSLFLMAIIISFLLLFTIINAQQPPPSSTGFEMGPEKQTHLHFFFHDIVSGSNPTAVQIAAVPKATVSPASNNFGALVMFDDPLTELPDPSSKLVGRAQGIYATASMEEAALLMTMTFHFTDGDFDGSTVAIVGRNPVFSGVREMPVVGGSGKFRWAQGYAVANTSKYDSNTGDATVEYDVYVTHRCGDLSLCSNVSSSGTSSSGTTTSSSGGGGSAGVVHGNLGVGFNFIVNIWSLLLWATVMI